jgi:hypothetical protein
MLNPLTSKSGRAILSNPAKSAEPIGGSMQEEEVVSSTGNTHDAWNHVATAAAAAWLKIIVPKQFFCLSCILCKIAICFHSSL